MSTFLWKLSQIWFHQFSVFILHFVCTNNNETTTKHQQTMKKNTISSSKSSTSSHFINFCKNFHFWLYLFLLGTSTPNQVMLKPSNAKFQWDVHLPGAFSGRGGMWDARPCELTCHPHYQVTPLKFNSSPLKIDNPKRKVSSSNHHFSGASC